MLAVRPEATMDPNRDTNNIIGAGPGDSRTDELLARLRRLEKEISDVLEQRKAALARPMRAAEKDALRRQFDRQEARLQESIKAIKALLDQD